MSQRKFRQDLTRGAKALMRIKGLRPDAQSVRAIVDREIKRLREMSDDEGNQQLQDAGEHGQADGLKFGPWIDVGTGRYRILNPTAHHGQP